MKFLKVVVFNLIVILFVFSCSSENNTIEETETGLNPSEYYEALNISYGDDVNQTFDLYLPANRTVDTEILVLVHGGGWSSGDKSEMNAFVTLIRQEFPNKAIANINYRLADTNISPYPMQINDITSVINYLKTNNSKYTISNTLGFIGVSAGAHLSLLWSYAFDSANNVKMVCSVVGPTNFTDPAYLEDANPIVQPLIDLFGISTETAFLEEISPYHQVKTTAPPTILFYGGKDPLIPTTQGIAMRDKLLSLDVTNEFTLYPEEGHGWDGIELLDTWTKLKAFIQVHLN
ncbi:alpha/beta hydrolase fold domain-containing protein [Algibacter sp. R77976]|uniref:alpha/beta hydrolase fold domain-containing protein n=1 Tax=Algibacter sp. R77976 TaxID=3093873 RepID=UPI0037C6A8B8